MNNNRLVFESAKWQSVTKVYEYKRMRWQSSMKAKKIYFMFYVYKKKKKRS